MLLSTVDFNCLVITANRWRKVLGGGEGGLKKGGCTWAKKWYSCNKKWRLKLTESDVPLRFAFFSDLTPDHWVMIFIRWWKRGMPCSNLGWETHSTPRMFCFTSVLPYNFRYSFEKRQQNFMNWPSEWMNMYVCIYIYIYIYIYIHTHTHTHTHTHCATNRKVAGSIPDGVIGIFHWHNPSGRTMALGLTQHLTEMSTRNISWGGKAAGA